MEVAGSDWLTDLLRERLFRILADHPSMGGTDGGGWKEVGGGRELQSRSKVCWVQGKGEPPSPFS